MYPKKEVDFLEKQLALYYDDYIKRLIEETALTQPTIAKFFDHKYIKPTNEDLIYRASSQLIEKKIKERNGMIKRLRGLFKVVSEDTGQSKLDI